MKFDWQVWILIAVLIGLSIMLFGYLYVEVNVITRYNELMKACPCWCTSNMTSLSTPGEAMNCSQHLAPEQVPVSLRWMLNISGGC